MIFHQNNLIDPVFLMNVCLVWVYSQQWLTYELHLVNILDQLYISYTICRHIRWKLFSQSILQVMSRTCYRSYPQKYQWLRHTKSVHSLIFPNHKKPKPSIKICTDGSNGQSWGRVPGTEPCLVKPYGMGWWSLLGDH